MKYNELLRKLKKEGWYEERQAAGSHIILKHSEFEKPIVFPSHGAKEIPRGLKKSIKKQAGLK